MSTASTYPHIAVDADGVARIGQTRYKVVHLAGEHYHFGWSAEELLRQHPDLRPEEIYATLTYFYDHHAQFVEQFDSSGNVQGSPGKRQPVSREELLRRRAAQDPQ